MKTISDYLVWTAVITPMNSDGSVDYESMSALLREQESADNAITILGSTGEALNIDESERKEILDFAIGLNLDVPLMVGVGGINLKSQTEWIEYLNGLKLDAYLLVVPLYAKPGIQGQFGWFKALLDCANKPCMIYNVPGRTAMKLEVETVKMLAGHKNFWAIKEASGSEDEFVEYSQAVPNVQMMSGDDPMLPVFAKHGARGVVSVAGNAWPQATHEYARQCIAGTFKDEQIWEKATTALFCSSNPVPVKALMNDQKRIKTPEVRLPLSAKDMPDISIVQSADKLVNEWFTGQDNPES